MSEQTGVRPMLGYRCVVFFDVDGTLVPGISSSQFLAERLGHHTELRVVEDDYAAGRVDNYAVAELDARGYLGATPEAVAGWLEDLPVVDGVQTVVQWCREHDVLPVLATLAWSPVGEYLCRRFGFGAACGPTLAVDNGRFTGLVDQNLSEYGKREFARTTAAAWSLPLTRCVAVGDSRSDLPLFSEVGLSIAFNGSGPARDLADVVIDSQDLRSILPHLGRWLARHPPAPVATRTPHQ